MFTAELFRRCSCFGHLDHATLLFLGVSLQPLPRQASPKEVHEDVSAAWGHKCARRKTGKQTAHEGKRRDLFSIEPRANRTFVTTKITYLVTTTRG